MHEHFKCVEWKFEIKRIVCYMKQRFRIVRRSAWFVCFLVNDGIYAIIHETCEKSFFFCPFSCQHSKLAHTFNWNGIFCVFMFIFFIAIHLAFVANWFILLCSIGVYLTPEYLSQMDKDKHSFLFVMFVDVRTTCQIDDNCSVVWLFVYKRMTLIIVMILSSISPSSCSSYELNRQLKFMRVFFAFEFFVSSSIFIDLLVINACVLVFVLQFVCQSQMREKIDRERKRKRVRHSNRKATTTIPIRKSHEKWVN